MSATIAGWGPGASAAATFAPRAPVSSAFAEVAITAGAAPALAPYRHIVLANGRSRSTSAALPPPFAPRAPAFLTCNAGA